MSIICEEVNAHIGIYEPRDEHDAALESPHAPTPSLPFEEVFVPVRDYIGPRLRSLGEFIDTSAAEDLAHDVIAELSEYFSATLLAEFSSERPAGIVMLARLSESIDCTERTLYRDFVKSCWRGRFVAILQDYPVLKRLLEVIVDTKLDEAKEFAQRLETDWPLLRDQLGIRSPRVVSIRGGLSDHHRGLRTVKIVTFDSGQSVVYKPKDLGLQVAWSALLNWVNERSNLTLMAPRAIDCATHGWVEFIPNATCIDAAAVQRFYRRAGALVCLVYAFRGSDCHFENMIACGEYPVLIDTETFLQPEIQIAGEVLASGTPDFLARHLGDAVVHSGLLPSWEAVNTTLTVNPSAFARMDASSVTKPGWRYVNSDYMYFGEPEPVEFSNANLPRIGDSTFDATRYVDQIVAGFEDTYRLLIEHREELLSETGPIAAFAHRSTRFVLRNTRFYRMLIDHSLQPKYLRSEDSFRKHFQDLIEKIPAQTYRWEPELVWNAEVAALTCLDIPMFTCYADSKTLFTDDNQAIETAIRETGYSSVRALIRSMSEEDRRRQAALIRMSFRALSAHEKHEPVGQQQKWRLSDASTIGFKTEACRLGRFLIETAIRGRENQAGWVALHRVPTMDRYSIEPLDHGIWSGTCGIALFLAALYRETGDIDYKRESLAAFARTRQNLSDTVRMGIGGGTGLGSIIYSLARAGRWLEEPPLIDDACRLADLMTSPSIAADDKFDVMDGAAGAILGLIALDGEAPHSCARSRAELCVEQLITHQLPKSKTTRPATGFAHGAAGIAYALMRWFQQYPEDRVKNAAMLALEYERTNYSASDRNWLDVRFIDNPDIPRYGRSWCHGAPGIGLSRVGLVGIASGPNIMQDIDAALALVLESTPPKVDQLCCGKFGWIDLILTGSDRLNRPQLYQEACRRAAGIVEEARENGGYRLLSGTPDDTEHPGLFLGIAGIGYELLRLADPKSLPSVLLFE